MEISRDAVFRSDGRWSTIDHQGRRVRRRRADARQPPAHLRRSGAGSAEPAYRSICWPIAEPARGPDREARPVMTLILRRSDLEPLVDMRATIDAIDVVMGDVARGTAVQPAPALMRLPGSESGFLPMAAVSQRAELATVKLLADVPA